MHTQSYNYIYYYLHENSPRDVFLNYTPRAIAIKGASVIHYGVNLDSSRFLRTKRENRFRYIIHYT